MVMEPNSENSFSSQEILENPLIFEHSQVQEAVQESQAEITLGLVTSGMSLIGLPATENEENVPNSSSSGHVSGFPGQTEDRDGSGNFSSANLPTSPVVDDNVGSKPSRSRVGYGVKSKHEPVLVPKEGRRTDLAKKRGEALVHAAKLFEQRCGGRVFLKAEYKSSRGTLVQHQHGSDFSLEEDKHDSDQEESVGQQQTTQPSQSIHPTTPEDLREIVRETVAEEVRKGLADHSGEADHNSQNLLTTPTTGGRRSAIPRRRTPSGMPCQLCHSAEKFITLAPGIIVTTSDWFFCSTVGCKARIHNECAGFPAVKCAEQRIIGDWFCQLHVGAGRPPQDDGDTDASENEDLPTTRRARTEEMPEDHPAEMEQVLRGRGRGGKSTRGGTGRGGRGGNERGGAGRGESRGGRGENSGRTKGQRQETLRTVDTASQIIKQNDQIDTKKEKIRK